jgi:arylsulfatase A-like enzyme
MYLKKIAFALLLCNMALSQSQNTPPNLIVIMTDDQGYADVGFNGCEDIPTPNIDAIANNGVKFTRGYVTYPVCGPSRAGFLTGRYQGRFGFSDNPSINPNDPSAGLPVEEETIAEVLKKSNYNNAIIGKWHMGTHPRFHPLERGFDYFFGFLSGGHNYFPEKLNINDLSEVKRKWQWYATKIKENRTVVEIEDYLTDELSQSAVKYIEKQVSNDQHFMLYLAYNAPHTPLQATPKYLSRFDHIKDPKRKTYAAMVSAVDDGVGQILKTLKKSGIEENTIVVFLSDNGGAKNNGSDNRPLRGRKSDLFEGGIRVPFAMQWKGTIPAGMTYEKNVSSLDIMATIVAQNKISIDKKRTLDGVNLIPFLNGENDSEPHDYLFWRKIKYNAMAVMTGDQKLVKNKRNDFKEMFNLSSDLSETYNLIEKNNTQSKSMQLEWELWNAELIDCIFPSLSKDEWW